ncbi:MAG: UvrD-helicase domain-containing protein [Planctomycetes bacterium]|nr:UvrD-helicase domain-containing protein [Planctomycetota bacterium]
MSGKSTPQGMPPADDAARQRAVTCTDRNLVVLAGAGSGKTALLIERALRTLLSKSLEPRQLAAITFTEAAAAEMRSRLREAAEELAAARGGASSPQFAQSASARLWARAVERGGTAVLSERAAELLGSLGRATVTTIHAFCSALLARHPLAARRGLSVQMDEGEERARVLREEWPAVLREVADDPAAADVLDALDLGDLRALFGDLLNEAVPAENWLSGGVPGGDGGMLERAVGLLLPHAVRLREHLRARGVISFDGLLVGARDLLLSDVSVRAAEKRRWRAILLDEFQDTDPLQYEIMLLLAEREQACAADPWLAPLEPGKLFVVGDPKQSIYRFRGADVEAYRRAVDRILEEGGEQLSLSVSFRSTPAVLGPIDRCFDGWLGSQNDAERAAKAAPDYEAVTAYRAQPASQFGSGARVEVWSVGELGETAPERRRLEGEWIAAEIGRSIAAGTACARNHAILLRAFSDVGIYAQALQQRGIPYLLQGGRTFYARTEVHDLIAWLRAVVEPNDAVSLLAALRSAAGAVPDEQLAAFAEAHGGARAWRSTAAVDPDRFPQIARALERIRELRALAAGGSAGDVVDAILERTRLLELHAAGFDGAQRMANLRKLAEQARGLAAGSSLSEAAAELVRTAGAAEGDAERSLAEESVDAVRILTIHKSKGLEFPVVFVADLAKVERAPIGTTRLAVSPLGALQANAQKSGMRTKAFEEFERREEAHRAAESRRLLYVAMTRAQERLVLLSSPGAKGPWARRVAQAFEFDPESPPADGAPLCGGAVIHRCVLPAAPKGAFDGCAPPEILEAASVFIRMREAAAEGARPPLTSPTALSARVLARRADEDDFGASVGEMPASTGAHARAAGTAMHRLLELWLPSSELGAAAIEEACRAAAREEATNPAALRADVAELWKTFASGSLAKRLRHVTVLARELPLLAPSGEGVVAGYADLVFEEGGALVVADWKSDRIGSESELAAAVEHHRPQVEWYAQALSAALHRPVRGELLFLRLDRSVALSTVEM